MNKVALIGPQHLQEHDKDEIFPFLTDILHESHISILAYRSFELDIVRYFLTLNDEFASHLTVYLVNTMTEIDETNFPLAQALRYLSSVGANIIEMDMPQKTLTRQPYLDLWKVIMEEHDELLSFYNHQVDEQAKLLAPLKIAEELEKNAYVFHLSDGDEEKMMRPTKEKIEQVRTISAIDHYIR